MSSENRVNRERARTGFRSCGNHAATRCTKCVKEEPVGRFEAMIREVFRYLVYPNNPASGKRIVKIKDLCDQKTAPLTPKSFIYNRRSYSQAGRRGFESRLPLHLFNHLRQVEISGKPTFRGNGVARRPEPLENYGLD